MSRKQERIMALAVSLWIAGGGIAAAAGGNQIYLKVDAGDALTVVDDDDNPIEASTTPVVSGKTLTLTGGNWADYALLAGGMSSTGNVSGYTLHLSHINGVGREEAIMAGGESMGGDSTSNHLVLDGVTASPGGWNFVGGAGQNANGNSVVIKNSNLAGGVTGGFAQTGTASGNEVTIEDSTVQAYGTGVYGVSGGLAYGGAATDNTVNLKNAVIGGSVLGGWQPTGAKAATTGNTLNLSGANRIEKYDFGIYNQAVVGANLSYDNLPEGAEAYLPLFEGRVQNFETVNITGANWGTPVLTLAGTGGILQNEDGSKAAIDASTLTFANPENIPNGASMNLIACENGNTITATLKANTTALQEYTVNPLAGLLVNAAMQGRLNLTETALTCTASNTASKLTFTDVEWKDTGALLDHSTTLTNVDFNGAAVDTSKINFTNIKSLTANKKMTLVKDFGDTVGNITGTEYTVGTVLKGKGKASLAGSDLIFTTETGTGGNSNNGGNGSNGDSGLTAQEQTHNAVMGMSAGMAALSAGNASIGEAVEGLGNAANQGADGVAVYAGMGGGSSRQETGSHVDSRTWNAILALGTKREQAKGTLEWGGFFEYGRSNYTLHSDAGRGDGHTHYTGGGVLAKWTNHHKTYIEASFRAGRMKDNAADIFQDAAGNLYGYNVRAGYHGAHIGLGQVFDLGSGRSLDVYGKFFYNKRNGVSFDAGGHYDLDAVASKILRIGTRYSAGVGRNWNWYGGLAYEYELDGEATGKVTSGGVSAPIRAADTSGGSALAELGLHLEPTAASPWKADIGLRGSCGKHRGVGGAVSVAYMF